MENDNGVRIYLDEEGGIDIETTDEVDSMQASIQTLTDDHVQYITGQSSPFVTVRERRGMYKDRNYGWLNTIDFNTAELILEETAEPILEEKPDAVTSVHRDEQQVEALMKLDGLSPDVMPEYDPKWINRLSMEGIIVCVEDGVL